MFYGTRENKIFLFYLILSSLFVFEMVTLEELWWSLIFPVILCFFTLHQFASKPIISNLISFIASHS